MTDFMLWGRIEPIGSSEFVVTATAVPENADPAEVRTLSEIHISEESATKALETLLLKVISIVREGGGTVTKINTGGL